jgi:hypothetical protein
VWPEHREVNPFVCGVMSPLVRLELEWICAEAHCHLLTDLCDSVPSFVMTYLNLRQDIRLPY